MTSTPRLDEAIEYTTKGGLCRVWLYVDDEPKVAFAQLTLRAKVFD